MIKVSPSIMCCDFLNLERQIKALDNANVDLLHIDIMDGHYVPNYGLNIDLIKTISKVSKTPMDVHIMSTNPTEYIEALAEAGATYIMPHIEALVHPIRAFKQIRALGKKSGFAINPATDLGALKYMIEFVDMICVMTVDPGFAGQTLIESTIPKITEIRNFIDKQGLNIDIMVDGQVNENTYKKLTEAGANVLVIGSSGLFKHSEENYPAVVQQYKNA